MALPVVGGVDATVQTGKDARRRRVPRPQEGGRQPQDRRGEGEAREDRAALQPGPHRPREDSLPSQFYLSVDVSLPGLAILSSRQTDERRIEMGKLIATTQATVDGVIDPVGEWVQPDTDHGDYSFERQASTSGRPIATSVVPCPSPQRRPIKPALRAGLRCSSDAIRVVTAAR